MRRPARLATVLLLAALTGACASSRHLVAGYPSINADLTINAVIENPAGTDAKWEVRPSGELVWEQREGRPKTTRYLPWPVNVGMIPRTFLDPEFAGDGEPLDVLVLGPSVERGTVVRAIVIGSIHIREKLHRDDKILAVMAGSAFEDVEDVEELDERFPGVKDILVTFYDHFGRPGERTVEGFGSRAAARWLIAECNEIYETRSRSEEGLPAWGIPPDPSIVADGEEAEP